MPSRFVPRKLTWNDKHTTVKLIMPSNCIAVCSHKQKQRYFVISYTVTCPAHTPALLTPHNAKDVPLSAAVLEAHLSTEDTSAVMLAHPLWTEIILLWISCEDATAACWNGSVEMAALDTPELFQIKKLLHLVRRHVLKCYFLNKDSMLKPNQPFYLTEIIGLM